MPDLVKQRQHGEELLRFAAAAQLSIASNNACRAPIVCGQPGRLHPPISET